MTFTVDYTDSVDLLPESPLGQEPDPLGLKKIDRCHHLTSTGSLFISQPSLSQLAPVNPQSFNRYVYALNDAVNLNDPSGLIIPAPTDDDGCGGGAGGPLLPREAPSCRINVRFGGEPLGLDITDNRSQTPAPRNVLEAFVIAPGGRDTPGWYHGIQVEVDLYGDENPANWENPATSEGKQTARVIGVLFVQVGNDIRQVPVDQRQLKLPADDN